MIRFLIGTQNPGKQREYHELLDGVSIALIDPAAVDLADYEPEENGSTFEENAGIKALGYALAADLPALADDSGLEVDVLDGRPGLYSARYAGPGKTDRDRYLKILDELQGVPEERRTARFVCVVALALPDRRIFTARGTVEGHIGQAPKGDEGFGYDPVFVLPDGRHMAELPAEEKHRISHRARALAAIKPTLIQVLTELNNVS